MERNVIIFMTFIFIVAVGTLYLAARKNLTPQAPVVVSTTTEGNAPIATSTATDTPRVPNSQPATSFTIQ